jgi:hypothetical protein
MKDEEKELTGEKRGLVDPLDLMVTAEILQRAQDLLTEVQDTRRTANAVNILKAFLDVPFGSELYEPLTTTEIIMWLSEYAQRKGHDPATYFGGNIYQNLVNLEKRRYLRSPGLEPEVPLPVFETTARGIAYLTWHNDLDSEALLRKLVTGTVKEIGFVPADISDTYKTPFQLDQTDDFYSAYLTANPREALKHTHHLIGMDSDKFVRRLTAGVFSKRTRMVWESLGTAQVPFLQHWVRKFIQPATVADSWLGEKIMPLIDKPQQLVRQLAEVMGYDMQDRDARTISENTVNEEICRVGWVLLKTAGDEATGITWAQEYGSDSRPQREQLEAFDENMVALLASYQGMTYDGAPKFDGEALENMGEQGRAELLERAQRAFTYMKSGDPSELLSSEELDDLYYELTEEAAAAQYEMHQEDIARDK